MTDELASVVGWLQAGAVRRDEILDGVAARLGLTPIGIAVHGCGAVPIGSVRHEPSGMVFRLLPGGAFQMGLSDGERRALEAILAEPGGPGAPGGPAASGDPDIVRAFLAESLRTLRPVREVRLRPFLIACHPLTTRQLRCWLPGLGPYDAGYLDDKQVDELCGLWPFRLPTEAEWEYAARAGTRTLTYRGDGVPDEHRLLTRFEDEAANIREENGFGLLGVGSMAEVCADVYLAGYAGAPVDGSARTGDGPPVVRGGAADLRPWQGCAEWLSMISAERQPRGYDVVVRPALSVPG